MILTHAKATCVSVGGVQYNADAKGRFDVPDEAAPKLIEAFGFRPPGAGKGKRQRQGRRAKAAAPEERINVTKADGANVLPLIVKSSASRIGKWLKQTFRA